MTRSKIASASVGAPNGEQKMSKFKTMSLATAAALLLMGASASAGPAEDVTQGTAFSAQGNYAEAMKLYAKAADAGDADGLFFLGRMYEKGQGVAQDITRGMGLYLRSRAAVRDDIGGSCLSQGTGRP
jgi:TPR repeat protein